jgi:hypothetical protein
MALTLRPTIASVTGRKRRCVCAESQLGGFHHPLQRTRKSPAQEDRSRSGNGAPCGYPCRLLPGVPGRTTSSAWFVLLRREFVRESARSKHKRGAGKTFPIFLIDVAMAFGSWITVIFVHSLVAHAVGSQGMSQAARFLLHRARSNRFCGSLSPSPPASAKKPFFAATCSGSLPPGPAALLSACFSRRRCLGAGHIYQGCKSHGRHRRVRPDVRNPRQTLRPGIITHAWHDASTGLVIRFLPK